MISLFWNFFKLGLTSYGGPMAAMALLGKEIQEKKKLVSKEDFDKSFFISKLLPGPAATSLSIRLGYLIGGRGAGVISGIGFILPTFLIVMFASHFITQYSELPIISNVLTGLRIGVLVLILSSLISFVKPSIKNPEFWMIFILSAPLLFFYPRFEPVLIVLCGVFMSMSLMRSREAASLLLIFWVCFKSCLFIFGTGFAVVPLLENEFVSTYHWITHEQFLNGLVIGQITPGPVLITATYLGQQAAGISGALVATLGTFLPAFLIVLFLIPWLERRFESTWQQNGVNFLRGAMPVILAGLGTSVYMLARPMNWNDPKYLVTGMVVLLVQWKLPSWAVIFTSGALFQMLNTF